MDIKTLAHEVFPYVVEMRRDFHMHPEPSFEEFRTTQRIAEELDKMGIACRLFEPTGLIGEIKGGKSGKCIALRADIDALTTQEKTGLPYASQKAYEWIAADDEMRQLCGYLLLARLFMKGMTPNERSANEFIDQARTARPASAPVRRAAVSALQKYQELGEEAFRAGEKVLEEAGL